MFQKFNFQKCLWHDNAHITASGDIAMSPTILSHPITPWKHCIEDNSAEIFYFWCITQILWYLKRKHEFDNKKINFIKKIIFLSFFFNFFLFLSLSVSCPLYIYLIETEVNTKCENLRADQVHILCSSFKKGALHI